MNLVVKKLASKSIAKTGDWVEKHNTDESGDRWVKKVYLSLGEYAKVGIRLQSCRNTKLSKKKYHCFTYNDKWVVAYRIEGNDFIVCRFILGAKLT
jgi:hypothetical protein